MNAETHRATTIRRFRAIKRPKEYSMPDTLGILWTLHKYTFLYTCRQEYSTRVDSGLIFEDNSCAFIPNEILRAIS